MEDADEIKGHYQALALAKRGIYPDGRTKLGKSLACFRQWLREPYGNNWNSLQEAREAIMIPFLLFWLLCPMVNNDGRLSKDYLTASNHLERALRDIADLGNKKPGKAPSLDDWIQAQEVNGAKN
jgi:hypothetical protein